MAKPPTSGKKFQMVGDFQKLESVTMNETLNMFSSMDTRKSKAEYIRVSGEKQPVLNFEKDYIPFGMWPEMNQQRQTSLRRDFK
jgi:hypothetical protein